MQERVCKVAHWYGGRDRVVGERFPVEPQHVVLELALGRIEPVEGEDGFVCLNMVVAETPVYMTRDMQAKRKYERKAGRA